MFMYSDKVLMGHNLTFTCGYGVALAAILMLGIQLNIMPTPTKFYGVKTIRLDIPHKDPEPDIWDTDTFLETAYNTDVSYIEQTEELICLAKNIYFEARDQDEHGQLAIAFVTQSRVNHRRWRDNICGVVYQRKQFSWYSDGKPDNPKHKESWNGALQIAAAHLNSYTFSEEFYSKPTPDITKGATHYHADYVEPDWALVMNKTTDIGTHIFYQ